MKEWAFDSNDGEWYLNSPPFTFRILDDSGVYSAYINYWGNTEIIPLEDGMTLDTLKLKCLIFANLKLLTAAKRIDDIAQGRAI